jgi:large subunit ribosomal protein L4
MQRAAIRSALSVKVAAGQLVVLDRLAIDAPKTKDMVKVLKALGVNEQSVVVVMVDKDMAVFRSAHNLPKVKTLLGGNLNVRDILGTDVLVLPREAVEFVETWLGADVSGAVSSANAAERSALPVAEE